MLAADVAAAAQVIIDGGWGDRTAFFDWAVDHPTCYPLVADAGGRRILGTGVATANGRVGWVGAIFVALDQRRNGLGTEAVDSRGRRAGAARLLDAGPDRDRRGPADLRATRVLGSQTRYVRMVAPEWRAATRRHPGPAAGERATSTRSSSSTGRDRRGPLFDPPGVRRAGDEARRRARRRHGRRVHRPGAVRRPGADRANPEPRSPCSTGDAGRPPTARSRSPCWRPTLPVARGSPRQAGPNVPAARGSSGGRTARLAARMIYGQFTGALGRRRRSAELRSARSCSATRG